MCHLRQEVLHDLKRRVIGLHFNVAEAIGEYVEKAWVASGPLFRGHAGPRRREKLSDRPMDSATVYRVIQGYLRRLPSAMKKERLEDGSEVEYCVHTPRSLRATTTSLLLEAGVDIKNVQDFSQTPNDFRRRQSDDAKLDQRIMVTTQIFAVC